MNPVLLYTDHEKINTEKAMLNKYLTIFQSVYNEFKTLGIAVTIQEIQSLVAWTQGGNGNPNFEQEFAIDKRMVAAGGYTFNNVPLNPDALRSIIQRPDVTGVKAALAQTRFIPADLAGRGARINLLSLANDVISKVADSDAQIEAIYTFYTKTDASAQLALNIQVVADVINSYNVNSNISEAVGAAFPGKNGLAGYSRISGMPGLAYFENAYHVSLDYIRRFEEFGAN